MKRKSFMAAICMTGMVASLLAGCGGTSTPEDKEGTAATTQAEEKKEGSEPVTITMWYGIGGDESDMMLSIIDEYNKSQDEIFVDALSVTDSSKMIVAMSSGEGPDVIRSSNPTALAYLKQGLIEDLNAYVEKDGFDTSVYYQKSLEANTADGHLAALPSTAYTIQMYYNKDILEQLGYTEPPTTMEEMYQMAVEATILDDSGNIDVLGYPLFPLASARQELVYGFGGRWWDEAGNPTPLRQENLDSLTYNVKYREQFGIDKVASFITTANTNRYTEKDMFFAGKQLFRFDGPWLTTMMESYDSDVNYGITMIPGATEADRGCARFESNCYVLSGTSKNKEAAWKFMKDYTTSEFVKKEVIGLANLPAYMPLFEDEEVLAVPAFKEFIDTLKAENAVQFPAISNLSEYVAIIDEYLDYIYNGSMTPEEGLKELEQRANSITLE